MNFFKVSFIILIVISFIGCSSDDNPVKPNNPPGEPTIDIPSGSPPHNSNNQSITPTLRWKCSDPDGDALRYDVYLGISSSTLPLVSGDQTATHYVPGTLDYNITCYWKIIAKDGIGDSTESSIWSFSTVQNPAPTIPSNFIPGNVSIEQPIDINLSWECSSPNNSTLKYDLYFGTSNNPLLYDSNLVESNYQLNVLDYNTTYYWKIIAYDDNNYSAESSMSSFSTDSAPLITLLSTYLNFTAHQDGGNPEGQHFFIENIGGSILNYVLSNSTSWLSYNPSFATAPDSVEVFANLDGLLQGEYIDSIMVSCTEASNSPQFLLCSLIVESPQILSVSPSHLEFIDSSVINLKIYNTGTGELNFTVTEDQDWIIPWQVGGTIPEETTLHYPVPVCVSPTGLTPGHYQGELLISSNGGDVIVPIGMEVLLPPTVDLWPQQLVMCEEIQDMFFIQNLGRDSVNWTIEVNQPWLKISSFSGSTMSEVDTVFVTIDHSNMDNYTYLGIIRVISNNESDTTEVAVEVRNGYPRAKVYPYYLDMGSSRTGFAYIENIGGAPLSWSVQNDNFRSCSPSYGTVSCNEIDTVRITGRCPLGYPNGPYNSNIIISFNSGNQIPLYVKWYCD